PPPAPRAASAVGSAATACVAVRARPRRVLPLDVAAPAARALRRRVAAAAGRGGDGPLLRIGLRRRRAVGRAAQAADGARAHPPPPSASRRAARGAKRRLVRAGARGLRAAPARRGLA